MTQIFDEKGDVHRLRCYRQALVITQLKTGRKMATTAQIGLVEFVKASRMTKRIGHLKKTEAPR